MRARYVGVVVGLGLVALALVPSTGLTQYPGGGSGGSSGRGGPGGGGPGGGGGFGGSRGVSSMDPAAMFDLISRGETSIPVNDNRLMMMREPLNEWMKRTNFTGTSINKEQFVNYGKSPEAEAFRAKLLQGRSNRGGPGGPGSMAPGMTGAPGTTTTPGTTSGPVVVLQTGTGSGATTPMTPTAPMQPGSGGWGDRGSRGGPGGPGGAPGGQGGWGYSSDASMERNFRMRDNNGDGVLNYDEMSDTLKGERDKWDLNHDGVVDQTEYGSYYKAFIEKQNAGQPEQGFGQGGWGSQGGGWGDRGDRGGWGDQGGYGGYSGGYGGGGYGGGYGGYGPQPTDEQATRKQEEKKVEIYRAGKLPENVPSWFKDMDKNVDGQVALYEWKSKDKSVDEFLSYDLNGDGFVTFQEAMLYETRKSGATAVASADTSKRGSGGSSRGGPGSGGTGDASSGRGAFGRPQGGTPGASPGTPSATGSVGGGQGNGATKSSSDRYFDMMAKGKETIVLSEVSSFMGGDRMREWAKKKNITTNQLTRDQYKEYMEEQRAAAPQWGGNRGTPGGTPGGTPSGSGATPGGPGSNRGTPGVSGAPQGGQNSQQGSQQGPGGRRGR